ncbi:hypothetical protein GIB67_028660 [Kingdonia uniflora]|uniref:Uncharacterized protein n=1 Tax=Kingdonia uniflora TaxID=39325 RepID=A0A7J7L1E5_9MAGN|nr:hypothetical protein GIB67_028660 [Kingdonia uniflora]
MSMHAIPVFNSLLESPLHPSFGRHSTASSVSRFSGPFKSSSGRKDHRKRNEKGWPECPAIMEEKDMDEVAIPLHCQVAIAILAFVLLFCIFLLILWGISRPYKPEIDVKVREFQFKLGFVIRMSTSGSNDVFFVILLYVYVVSFIYYVVYVPLNKMLSPQSLTVNNFYFGMGTDSSRVPTKMLTFNCSLKISTYSPASFFGIHVTSMHANLMYTEIPIVTGQVNFFLLLNCIHMV